MPPALRTGATIDVHGTGMVLAASTARRVGGTGIAARSSATVTSPGRDRIAVPQVQQDVNAGHARPDPG